jgi:putative toxin-antitoxin system antitoxin component (TIGR02293 family)
MLTKEDRAEIKRLIEEEVQAIDLSALLSDDVEPAVGIETLVDVTARAIEVLGTREKALRWLKTPVLSLGDQTPLSLLGSPDGIVRVEDALGRIEHGVW